ncbi:MAG: oxygen-dependent protoporphyrinogen oxidase, partial [Myxococcota bacterium]
MVRSLLPHGGADRYTAADMRIVVIGGGISGLATAWQLVKRLRATSQPHELTLLEASARLGGTIHTSSRSGFSVENGPNGFLDSKPDTVDLVEELGLGDRVLVSSDAARRRFVLIDGELVELPTSAGAFLKSKLLSVGGRMRVMREPWVRRGGTPDETVAEFARRRLGKQVLDRLIDPFVSGIFAGDPARLSVAAAFPRLVELEETYGSLIKASRQLKRERGDQVGTAGPGGKLTSFVSGMQELVDALGLALGDSVRLNERVEDLRRSGERWVVSTASGRMITDVDIVVLAVPAYAAAKILGQLSAEAASALADIPYAAASVVAFGYHVDQVAMPLDGFGFLVPQEEERPILGCLWSSSVFPGERAPPDHVL